MRGKVRCQLDGVCLLWITPAYAGKSTRNGARHCKGQDHPRTCGEKLSQRMCMAFRRGSPPRMRGKEPNTDSTKPAARITPAYAGKRTARSASCTACGDHPRACGEKPRISRWCALSMGSPPRMRGKGGRWPCGLRRVGITPAHAGKSWQSGGRPKPWQDHPRVCGEKPNTTRS